MHVKKGDRVIVLSGKDAGVVGRVIRAYPKIDRVLVEGVNIVKKHTKITPTSRGGNQGGIVHQEAPIHVSNVLLAVDQDGKTVGSRVGYRFDEDGRKIRVARKTGEDV